VKLTIRKPSSETVVVKEIKTKVKTPSVTATAATSISRAPSAAAPPTAPASASVSIGEPIEVELDANAEEDGPSQMVWAAATVSRIDEPLDQFYVSVTEWASLDDDDPDQEDAYEEGPYDAEGEGTWWRRLAAARADSKPSSRPAAAAEIAMDDDVPPALAGGDGLQRGILDLPGSSRVQGWWRQDVQVVQVVLTLAAETNVKRDVAVEIRPDQLEIRVEGAVVTRGSPAHGILVDESDWYVVSSLDGFSSDGRGSGRKFLVVEMRKAAVGVDWTEALLEEGRAPAPTVTIKSADGVRITRADGTRSAAPQPTAQAAAAAASNGSSSSGGVKVTIRVKNKGSF